MPSRKPSTISLALRRHWVKSVSIAAAMALLTMLGLEYVRPQYASEARLAVQVADGKSTPQAAAAGDLASIVELLESPDLHARVARAIGEKKLVAHDQIARGLQVVTASDRSEITIRCTAPAPELAQQIVATLVSLCLEELEQNAKKVAPPPPSESTADEQKLLENDWQTASARLRQAQAPGGELSLAGQRKLLEDQLAEVEVQLLRELAQHEAEEERLKKQLTPVHPHLVALRDLIEAVSRQIHGPASPEPAASNSLNDEKQIPGIVGRLCSKRDELRNDLAALSLREGIVADAVEQADAAQARLNEFARKQATSQPIPDVHRIVRAHVVQPATPPTPVGIPAYLIVAAGVGLGLAGAIGVPLVCYRADPVLRTCRDVAGELELVVSGPIPVEVQPLETAV